LTHEGLWVRFFKKSDWQLFSALPVFSCFRVTIWSLDMTFVAIISSRLKQDRLREPLLSFGKRDAFMNPGKDLLTVSGHKILFNVQASGSKVSDWALENRQELGDILLEKGCVLIRGLKILSSKQFGMVLQALFDDELIDYTYRSTPRTELRGKVYTATEYPAAETIPQHNENSYSNSWPLRIGFLCMQPSVTGGETPLADSRLVYQRIEKDVRERFERKGVMYVRNYSDLDLPWSEVFQTEDKDEVAAFCEKNGLEYHWGKGNHLRTCQVNPATASHPITGEKVWFNQAHLFHVSSLNPDVRNALLEIGGEENLPRNTYFSDGSEIPAEDLDHIREVYEALKFQFTWQRYDLLLVDNMLCSHGRNPFEGERKILVGMTTPQFKSSTP